MNMVEMAVRRDGANESVNDDGKDYGQGGAGCSKRRNWQKRVSNDGKGGEHGGNGRAKAELARV
jgi:hypothetical protein